MECTGELRLHLSRKRSKAGFFPQHKPVISRWYGNDKHHPRLCKKADDAGDTINPRDWGCHSRAPWPQELPHGKEEVGEWQRNQGEATGLMRIGRNHSQGKKAVWKRRKVEKFWGNARLVYRASFGGRSSLQFLLCLGFGLD